MNDVKKKKATAYFLKMKFSLEEMNKSSFRAASMVTPVEEFTEIIRMYSDEYRNYNGGPVKCIHMHNSFAKYVSNVVKKFDSTGNLTKISPNNDCSTADYAQKLTNGNVNNVATKFVGHGKRVVRRKL